MLRWRAWQGTRLHDALVILGGSLRDRPAEREREQQQRADATATASASMLVSEAWFGSWWSALEDDGTITRLLRRGNDRLLPFGPSVRAALPRRAAGVAGEARRHPR